MMKNVHLCKINNKESALICVGVISLIMSRV